MGFWRRVLIDAVFFIAIAGLFRSSFHVSNIWVALIASLVLAILNSLIKPVLVVLSLPITFLTLGLFSVVINGLMLQLTSAIVGSASFGFASFWTAIWVSIIMSIANAIVSNYFANN